MSGDLGHGLPISDTLTWSNSTSQSRRDTLVTSLILISLTVVLWWAAFYIAVLRFPPESAFNFLTLSVLIIGTGVLIRMFIHSYVGARGVGNGVRLTKTHPWFGETGLESPAAGFMEQDGVRWLERGDRLEIHTSGLFGEFTLRIRNESEVVTIETPRWSKSQRTARIAVSALNSAAAVADAEARRGEDPSLIGARERESLDQSLLERSWDSTTPGLISDDVRSGIQQILTSRDSGIIESESE